jgi:ADP-L-glycero-D-manno-heptose 6-epimerase
MIALTGAGGFIGSVVLGYLNSKGITDVYLFDDLPEPNQFKNLIGKRYLGLHSTKEIVTDIKDFDCVIHIGANSNTLEKDWSSIYDTNVLSTRRWHDLCREHDKKFIFTSSAAVYGNGQGPLNQYAFSKLASEQEITNGVVLRLFNVYGPNEYHKGRMASTVLHWYNQIQQTGQLKIFKDSNQYRRDFIYVEDVASTIHHFVNNYKPGIYDLGTGISVDFDSIANAVIEVSKLSCNKEYIDMPADLKAQYQTDTKASTDYLIEAGVDVDNFREPWDGIKQYVDYLKVNGFY